MIGEKVRLKVSTMNWYIKYNRYESDYNKFMENAIYMGLFKDEYIGEIVEIRDLGEEEYTYKIKFPNGFNSFFSLKDFYKKYKPPEDFYYYKPEYF